MACITSDTRIFVNNELREMCKESIVFCILKYGTSVCIELLRNCMKNQTTPLSEKTEASALLSIRIRSDNAFGSVLFPARGHESVDTVKGHNWNT
jgi:hypothetical protein